MGPAPGSLWGWGVLPHSLSFGSTKAPPCLRGLKAGESFATEPRPLLGPLAGS